MGQVLETHGSSMKPLRSFDCFAGIVGQWAKDMPSTNGNPDGPSQTEKLNPTWELSLQGFPLDWLDIGEEELSKLSGIRLSRSAQK